MTTVAQLPPGVLAYVGDVASALAASRSDLVGVYVHGSAVLGGFRPGGSDVDVLAVVAGPGTAAGQQATGETIVAVGGCPGTGLELSAITSATAAVLGDCRFEVHVNTVHREPVIVAGAGQSGDDDLVLHSAVRRQHAVAVTGPPADQVFGPVPRERVLAAMLDELRWGIGNAPTGYAVLNACRAARFAEDGRLCSKVDGGGWYLARHPGDRVVTAALEAQRGDGPGPALDEATGFVTGICDRWPAPAGNG